MRKVIGTVFVIAALIAHGAVAGPSDGDEAPAFRLQDQNSDWHTLEDYRGRWVVLFFYPKADTPGCTTEACEFRDNIFANEEAGATVIGVSLDDVDSQEAFAENTTCRFPCYPTQDRKLRKAMVVLTKFRDMPVRHARRFLIAPNGVIAKHYKKVDPKTHSAQVLEELSGRVQPPIL